MLAIFKKFFPAKYDPDELIIYARVWVDYDSKEGNGHFSLKKAKATYNVAFTTHVSEISYFYAVPEEQWSQPDMEECYIKTKCGYSYFINYNYLKLQKKFLLYYQL